MLKYWFLWQFNGNQIENVISKWRGMINTEFSQIFEDTWSLGHDVVCERRYHNHDYTYENRVYAVIVNNYIDINKSNNYILP